MFVDKDVDIMAFIKLLVTKGILTERQGEKLTHIKHAKKRLRKLIKWLYRKGKLEDVINLMKKSEEHIEIAKTMERECKRHVDVVVLT
jgi:hypothetical protein